MSAGVAVVLAVLLTLIMPTAVVVELGWRDSGYDLAPGYRYTITLRSGRVWTGSCALAAIDATVIKAELRGNHLKVWINGQLRFDQDIDSESITLTIIVDHDGSGVVESSYGRLGGFSIDSSYRIMVYTETVSAWPQSVTSEVTISRQRLPAQPTQPIEALEEPRPNMNLNLLAILGGAASVGILMILILLGLIMVLWILGRMGGVRGLVKKAL